MHSVQHSIPIPHRQPRDGARLPAAPAAVLNYDPQFPSASHSHNAHLPSSQFDDEFWGVFELDDLDAGSSFPPRTGTQELTRPEVLPNNTCFAHPATSQGLPKDGDHAQSTWDLNSNWVLPPRPQAMHQYALRPFGGPPQPPVGFGRAWPGRLLQNQQACDSPDSHDTAATSYFSDRDSLRISRMPSLGTNPSFGTLSWENSPDVPEIFGASKWTGISSFSPRSGDDAAEVIRSGTSAQLNVSPDGKSSGMESQCGTSPKTTHEDLGVQAPAWFDYGNLVTQPQGLPIFMEQTPLFPGNTEVAPHMESGNMLSDFHFFDNKTESQAGFGFEPTYETHRDMASSSSLYPVSPESVMHYTPPTEMMMELSLSSQDLTAYTPPSIVSPTISLNQWQLPSAPSHAAFNDVSYANTVNGSSPQNLVPYLFPQPPEDFGMHAATADEMMEGVESNHRCFVIENGCDRPSTPPSHRPSGRRGGRLKPEVATQIALKRKERKTCLRCRVARVTCDGGNPCGRCVRLGQPAMLEGPCILASFVEIVKSGTLNYISQRNINHFGRGETYRVKILLPETFDVSEFLGLLNARKRRFNIRARQASGSLYVLDLAKCYEFLKKIPETSRNGDLRTFIDDILVKTDSWYKCVKEVDPTKNKTLLLSKWNNMPSRASYDLVPLDGSPSRPLDPEDDADRQEIMLAAQMSRIICRKLELDGYKALQALINNMRTHNTSSEERKAAVQHLGKILVSLRWRMSWWQLLGDGSGQGDLYRERFVARVEELTRTLYFYYFAMRRSIGSFVDLGGLEGVVSRYPDAEPVWDDFPAVQSVDGFKEWLEMGKTLIFLGNVERRVSA